MRGGTLPDMCRDKGNWEGNRAAFGRGRRIPGFAVECGRRPILEKQDNSLPGLGPQGFVAREDCDAWNLL